MAKITNSLILESRVREGFIVRSITDEDIEILRQWKNENRHSFFFKEIITIAMQQEWFRAYGSREHDFMMVLVYEGKKIGCIGFRRLEDRVDLYNLIVGQKKDAGQGHMTLALDLVCMEAARRYPREPVMVSVLRTNPAVAWYLRRGFTVVREHADHFEFVRGNIIHKGAKG